MKTKKSKDAEKKKATKAEKVQGMSKVAKKLDLGKMKTKNVEVASKKKVIRTGKVQNPKNNVNKKEMDTEARMLQNVIVMAENLGIDVGGLIKTTLIRAIQRVEGSNECYMTGEVLTCGQMKCLWREECAPF